MVLVVKPRRRIYSYKELENHYIVFEPYIYGVNPINWAISKIMELLLGRKILFSKMRREGVALLVNKESGTIETYCIVYSSIKYGRTGICMGDLSKLTILRDNLSLKYVLIPEEKKKLLGEKIKIRILKRSVTTSKKYLFFEIL